MKKFYLLCLVLITTVTFGQETEFKFTKDGFTDFVVTQVEGKTQAELYQKTLEWVQVTYNTPKEVLKGQIENDYIRIEGVSKDALCSKIMGFTDCSSLKYQIEISFKNGKYKFDVISVEYFYKGSQYSPSGWYPLPVDNPKGYFKENGEIRNQFKLYPETIENLFNSLNLSLKNFLLGQTKLKTKDW